MNTKIKICGMTRWQDVKSAVVNGADFIGFIHSDKSKRNVSIQRIQILIKKLKDTYPKVKSVCVVTTEDLAEIDKITLETKCDYIQVHNDIEYTEFNSINFINKIKVFRLKGQINTADLKKYNAFFFLWDTYSSNQQGGTGEVFNWEFLPKEYLNKSFVAGGINENNIIELINNYSPFAVDLSSSLELRPGIKSKAKIEKIFRIIRRDHIKVK